MTNQELLKLLTDKKLADSYQYYEACQYKLYLAEISCEALDKVINDFETTGTETVNRLLQDAIENGKSEFRGMSSTVNYCGIEIPVSTAMTKLTMEVMSLLHNFFDTFAQWLNLVLFGSEALPIRSVSISSVISKLSNYPEYTGQFIDDLKNVTSKTNPTDYIYISDFNNIVKHRTQIHVMNSINMFTAQGSVAIPPFMKDGNSHDKIEVVDVIHSGYRYCEKLLEDSRQYIEQYYAIADSKYVDHRYYNPKEFLFFETEDDYRNMRKPKNHYAYLEADPTNIDTEYDIMIVRDRTNQEDGRIELYNAPYPILMLREIGTTNILGILIPEDDEEYKPRDHHMITYRKYIPKTSGYQREMFKAICEGIFHYHPFLVDNEILIETLTVDEENSEKEKTGTNPDVVAGETDKNDKEG